MSLEKTYKGFSHFIAQCLNTIVSFAKILIRSKIGIHIPPAESETCIVLGNGPSLKTSLKNHPAFFKKHPLVCVNSYATTEEYTLLKPHYYVVFDSGWWMSDGKAVLDSIEAMRTRTTWPLELFVPRIASKSNRFTELCAANKNIKLNYFNYTVFEGFTSIAHLLYNKNLAMPQSQNVLVASIFLSINMGFKKIMIVGADHSWHQTIHLDNTNTLCIKDIHFYEEKEKVNYQPYKKGLHINENFKMHEILGAWSKAFYGYIALENYAKYKNCKIYNASEVTFIDAFEQIKIDNN